MMISIRKPWYKPELTVLMRNQPEEAVLAGCKTPSGGYSDLGDYNNCAWYGMGCEACLDNTGS